jgi:hypothetical protein
VPRLSLAVAACAVLVAGCGSSGPSPAGTTARAGDFPKPSGRTLRQLAAAYPSGPVLVPSVSSVEKGVNRLGFGLFTKDMKQVPGASIAVYTADGKGAHVKGPYLARLESLSVKPQFQSRTTATDPDSAKEVYVAQVPFARDGPARLLGLARVGGRLQAAGQPSVDVGAQGGKGPPQVGDRAIPIHTPTLASAGGDAAKIDTRVPPATSLLQADFASVLGRKPVVLVFATPALCQSRVCGPVVDVEAQVQSQLGDRVAFIHQEIYNNNKVQDGYARQVGAWRLPSEPWAFAIDRRGVVVARFEGAFSAAELRQAAERALKD